MLERKLLRRVKRKVVFMKLVILFVDFDGDKCMYFFRYNIRLFVFVRYVRFFNIFIIDYK